MCTRPVALHLDRGLGLEFRQVPCGKCCECKKSYQNDWTIRAFYEFKKHGLGYFITLTYNEDSVPFYSDTTSGEAYRTVYKKHVQDWFKRWRTAQARKGSEQDLVYFLTSEYGPRTLRPHYHALLFGINEYGLYELLEDWRKRYGFVSYYPIPFLDPRRAYGACRYVGKYCSKGVFENPRVQAKLVQPTFHLVSKGFGSYYVELFRDYHLAKDSIYYARRLTLSQDSQRYNEDYVRLVESRRSVKLPSVEAKFRLPRYYKEKIFSDKVGLSAELADFLYSEQRRIYYEEFSLLQANHPDWTNDETYRFMALSKDRELVQREKDAKISLETFFNKSKI